MKKYQQGMTFFGVVFVGAAIVMIAVLGMKMVPAYLEFFSVKKIINAMAADPAFSTMDTAQLRASFDRRSQIDYVKVISGKDLHVEKSGGRTVVSANYDVVVPVAFNVSVIMEFEASTANVKQAKMVGG